MAENGNNEVEEIISTTSDLPQHTALKKRQKFRMLPLLLVLALLEDLHKCLCCQQA